MRRRKFIGSTAAWLAGLTSARLTAGATLHAPGDAPAGGGAVGMDGSLTLFLGGDVMTGRGIDQALPHSVDPRLHEQWVTSAEDYVRLAENENGELPLPLDYAYPWGDALAVLDEVKPIVRWINLETAVTAGGDPDPEKGIHYRMHPDNVPCLTAAGLDGVSLANNHVLDWGLAGLEDTLRVLAEAGIRTAGAGKDIDQAAAPQVFETASGRVVFLAACTGYSGVPHSWAAGPRQAGVNRIMLSARSVGRIAESVASVRRPGDRVVLSLHWGGNWGYEIAPEHRDFAHAVIDEAGIDLLHGHSSHHPMGIELYQGKAILYGCGDFLNDYEGIRGDKGKYRGELTAMYFPTLGGDGRITSLDLVPMRIRRFRLQHASDEEARWLAGMLDRESRPLGARAELGEANRIRILPAS